MRRFFLCCLVPLAAACGGSSADVPAGPGTETPANPGEPPPSSSSEATITIAMRGSTEPFTHADAYAGQTPRKQITAVKSLWLYRSPTDTAPLRVFDHGDAPVEVDLVTEDEVVVATVPVASLTSGRYTFAKVGVSYVKYAVDATMHGPVTVSGFYDNVQALSDGAIVDGTKRKRGWHRYSFVSGGMTLGTTEGENAPTPIATSGGGISMDMSGPETFYAFAVDVTIDDRSSLDHLASFVVNVHESFRWQDQPYPGYTAGVFDTTPATFEPVMAFGASAFSLTVTPKN